MQHHDSPFYFCSCCGWVNVIWPCLLIHDVCVLSGVGASENGIYINRKSFGPLVAIVRREYYCNRISRHTPVKHEQIMRRIERYILRKGKKDCSGIAEIQVEHTYK